MNNLTEAQRELLTRAATRTGDVIDTFSPRIGRALMKRGLAMLLAVEGGASRLIITEAGRAAIAVEPDKTLAGGVGGAGDTAAAAPAAGAKAREDASSGKLGTLAGLLWRPEGATVEAMMEATGWQAHSVRGAMSGSLKKGLGLAIVSEKTGAGRIYRIISTEPQTRPAPAPEHHRAPG